MPLIDLNADLAEGFPWDAELLEVVTSANVCCGIHAGSVSLCAETMRLAAERGIRVGLHPGYNDLDTMGRTSRPLLDSVTRVGTHATLKSQCQIAMKHGVAVEYLKPHGAFYHQSASEQAGAGLLLDLLVECKLPLMGLPYSLHEEVAAMAEVALIREGFADRRLDDRGFLVPRSDPHALIEDPQEAAAQALKIAGDVDTICLHGDQPGCVERARAVRAALEAAGFTVGSSSPE